MWVAVLVAACGDEGGKPPPRAAGPAIRWIAGPGAFGPIRFGMSAQEVGTALGEPLQTMLSDNESCGYATPSKLPTGVTLMVFDDDVVRVDVLNPNVKTLAGAAVGDTEARVVDLYEGTVTIEPHKYADQGHYLVVAPVGDTLHRIIFETDGEHVVTYRSGLLPYVAYVEGCS